MITLVLLIGLVLLVALFSIQNAAPVVITLFLWKFEASLAIVVFLSVLAGVIIMGALSSVRAVRRSMKRPRDPAAALPPQETGPPSDTPGPS